METPNLPDASVPRGTSEDENVESPSLAESQSLDSLSATTLEIGELFSGLDFDRAAQLSGSRFVTIHGALLGYTVR